MKEMVSSSVCGDACAFELLDCVWVIRGGFVLGRV